MKFGFFREFKEEVSSDGKNPLQGIKTLAAYLQKDLASMIREMRTGLVQLAFKDNFESFRADITIPALQELAIRNELRSVPSIWFAVKKNEAALSVCDGDSTWTTDFLYLKNTHATDPAVLSVIFMR